MPVYSKGRPRKDGEPTPAMLAIGDSWFWYLANNLMDGLVRHPKLRPGYAAVQLFGYNGAHVADYVGKGKYARDFEVEQVAPVAGRICQGLDKAWIPVLRKYNYAT
jgi:hypothetical protein